jgi:Fic family protein
VRLFSAKSAENKLYIYRINGAIMPKYIYQYPSWPAMTWNDASFRLVLGEIRHLQGKLLGRMESLGFVVQKETLLKMITRDVVTTAEIEGEKLNEALVRSSVAKQLGLPFAGVKNKNRAIEGIVQMMLNATQHYQKPMTKKRLFEWHSLLFPAERWSVYSIDIGTFRREEMQIVSGPLGKEQLHYEAISAKKVPQEMTAFLSWCNKKQDIDPVVKAAVAHFWFIIIHPFDDGNGRIGRAISDLFLCRADASSERYYSLSEQMLIERKSYYAILKKVQHSEGDITPWIHWFLQCLKNAVLFSLNTLDALAEKTNFWHKHELTPMNERQRKMIHLLYDGFDGHLKSSKWAKMMKCSPDTALRDINDLIAKGILEQQTSGGRSTHYVLLK